MGARPEAGQEVWAGEIRGPVGPGYHPDRGGPLLPLPTPSGRRVAPALGAEAAREPVQRFAATHPHPGQQRQLGGVVPAAGASGDATDVAGVTDLLHRSVAVAPIWVGPIDHGMAKVLLEVGFGAGDLYLRAACRDL